MIFEIAVKAMRILLFSENNAAIPTIRVLIFCFSEILRQLWSSGQNFFRRSQC